MVYETAVWVEVVVVVVVVEIVHTMQLGCSVRGDFRRLVVHGDGSSVSCGRTALPFGFDIEYSRS